MEDAEGGVHIGEAEVEGGGGEDAVPLQHARGQLGHVGQAPEVLEVYVNHLSGAEFLKIDNSSINF